MSDVQGSLVTGLVITFLPTLAVLGLLCVWLTVLAGYRHLGKTRHDTLKTRRSILGSDGAQIAL